MSCTSNPIVDLFTCPPPPPVSPDPVQAEVDARVYALVITGKVLFALAVVTLVLSITFAAVFTPFWALGLVAVVAMVVFACMLSQSRASRHHVVVPGLVSAPFYPGQPVGISNGGSNCWANSMWQFLMHSPRYVTGLQALGVAALNDNITAYQQAGAARRFVSNVSSQQIRTTLSQRMGIVGAVNDPARVDNRRNAAAPVVEYRLNPQSGVQEDPAEPLEHLLRAAGFATQMVQTVDGRGSRALDPEVFIPLSFRHARDGQPFDQHFQQHFQFITERDQEIRRYFQVAPEEFIVKQVRYLQQNDPNTGRPYRVRCNQAIPVPERYMLPGAFIHGGGDETPYECDFFISHHGHSVNSGHYVAYVKNTGADGVETFWLCDDGNVSEVSRATYLAELSRSYIQHFKRLS
jgi:hypothetical protein